MRKKRNRKRVLYLHQYFLTPEQPGGTRSYWVAKKMIDKGLDVVMITSSYDSESKKTNRVNIDGIDVVYISNFYDNKMGFVKRLISFLSFMFKATYYALKEKDIDIVFATSTPLTIGVPALIKKWFQGTPFIFEVRDLWPEVPIQMGALDNFFLKKIALSLEKLIYSSAKHVIALSPGMEEGVLRFKFMEGKTSMIPNMSKPDIFFPREIENERINRFNINLNKFNAVHFGAMGIANGLDYIIKAAIHSKKIGNDYIQFHFLGKGKVEEELKKIKKKEKLNNVHFHGAHPMESLSHFVNACDISLVSFMDLPILRTNSPNKLFDSLSAGKPIIVNSSGWTKDLVEKYNCGLYVDPKKPEDLVKKIIFLSENKSILKEMGDNSRKISESLYDKDLLSLNVFNTINKFV